MSRLTLFQCPVCRNALAKADNHYRCSQGHTYDIARQGHVNLLLPRHIGRGKPGDSKEMLQSRREILNAGYYLEFSDQLNGAALRHLPDCAACAILDAGCGEGYYTSRLRQALIAAGRDPEVYGVDVAKRAVQYAAARDKAIRFAVASTYHLPIQDKSMDLVLCIFAPRDEGEFARVLKPQGKLAVAAPGPRHLFSLRSLIYQDPEEIGQRGDVGGGFRLLDQVDVCYTVELEDKRAILNLLTMTPYSKHIDEAAMGKLRDLPRLEAEIDIRLKFYGL
jgi:23S rRNA (guanine745-N1)-methyltransferase